MSPSTDLNTLLYSIRLNPSDDLARLAYADALEEEGQVDRAEFIRTQIELWQTTFVDCRCGRWPAKTICSNCRRRLSLWERARELFRFQAYRWLALRRTDYDRWEFFDADRAAALAEGVNGGIDSWDISVREKGDGPEWSQTFRRGFVHTIRLPTPYFLTHAKKLFSLHPLEQVVLTDREPISLILPVGRLRYCWRRTRSLAWTISSSSEKHRIPSGIWPYLTGTIATPMRGMRVKAYDTPLLALEDLRRACVRYGLELTT